MAQRFLIVLLLLVASPVDVFADSDAAPTRTEQLHAALDSVKGVDRIPHLAELLEINRLRPVRGASGHGLEALRLLEGHPDPVMEIQVRMGLSWALCQEGSAAQALLHAETAYKLAVAHEESQVANALYHLAVAQWYTSDHPTALANAQQAVALQTERDDWSGAATSLTLLGAIQRSRSDYVASLESHFDALQLAEEAGDASAVARSRNNIALLYRELDRPEQALEFFRQAGEHYRASNRIASLTSTLNNIGFTLNEMGRAEEALPALAEALNLNAGMERPRLRARILSNLAFAWELLDDNDRAMSFHHEALALREQIQDRRGSARTLGSMAKIFLERQQYATAGEYLDRAYVAAESVGARSEKAALLELMAQLHTATGSHEEALTAFQQHREISDEIDRDSASVKIAQLEAEREIVLKELELNRQRSRTTALILTTLLLLLSTAGLVLFLRARSRTLAAFQWSNKQLKEAARQIQESEQRYRSLFYDGVVPKFLLDVETNRLVDANESAARLCGTERSSLRDLPLESLEPAWLRRVASHCGAISEVEESTARFVDEFGAEHQVQVRLAPVNVKGRSSVVATIHDLTEEERLEQERIRVDKLQSLGLLAGGIAHDFNNALTSILGHLTMAKRKAGSDSAISPMLEEAEAAVDHSADLTRQLLTFSKGGEPRRDLQDVATSLRSAIGFALSGTSIGVKVDIELALWLAKLDVVQFKQLVSNLVINAVQAMEDQGQLTVTARNFVSDKALGPTAPAGNYVRIDFSDTGPGVSASIQSKIMDPYFTTKSTGSGLGLASAFAIASRHEGWLEFSNREDGGATFSVYLPATPGGRIKAVTVPSREARFGTERILVLEDDGAIQAVYRAALEERGYSVEVFGDGREAISAFREARITSRPFDVVIMDLTVPGGMGGKAAMAEILEADPGVLGVVASGYSNDPVIFDYESFGFRAALPKPFAIDDVARVVREVLDSNN